MAVALSTPAVPVSRALRSLVDAVNPHVRFKGASGRSLSQMLGSLVTFSGQMLCFWLRGGALYEPTLPLGTLLGGCDIAKDLPLQYLAAPAPALCVLPPWQQRHHCAGTVAIMMFTHDATPTQAPAQRTLTLLAYDGSAIGVSAEELTLPVKDETETISETLQRARTKTLARAEAAGFAEEAAVDASVAMWERVLDYVAKLLLYLQLDQPSLRRLTPYSSAPKEFPGLGRRKREERLAQVEQLYDRYIIGPESLTELLAAPEGERLPRGHELPAHWRRGHFRLQAHGPAASLRKVLFIPPTVVRADRLAAASGAGA